MATIDLHIHSTYSDGELTPKEILNYCYTNGVTTISITDHENYLGSKEAININPYKDLKVIPGIELEAHYPNGQLHILGYNISFENKELNEITKLKKEDNKKKIISYIQVLYDTYGFKFKDEDIEELLSKECNLGRPHIAYLCVKYGYIPYVKYAFKHVFPKIKDKIVKKQVDLTEKECIDYLLNAGGIVSVAHPKTLKLSNDELFNYLAYLSSLGVSAIEVYHSSMSHDYSLMLSDYADRLGLLKSGGSDFHGKVIKPEIQIATGNKNNLNIDYLNILSKI